MITLTLRRTTHKALRRIALDRDTTMQDMLETEVERIVAQAGAAK